MISRKIFSFALLVCAVVPLVAGELFSRNFTNQEQMIAVELQWCYPPHPSLATMMKTLEAAADCGYNAIMPEFGPTASWSECPDEYQDDKRAFLRACVKRGVLVIPKVNSLGHSDRGFRWPAYLGKGVDMGVEKNYTALEAEVAAWKRELAAAGQAIPYFHFGMDEASACMKANTEKYGKNAAELLAEHCRKVADICRKHAVRGIIYHDMLVGGSESMYWREVSTFHADQNGSWKARPEISRDFIIAYWNYEPFNRYRTVENLHDEGFDIIFTPWGSESARTMVKNSRLYGIGVCASTWVDFTAVEPGKAMRGNSFYSSGWILDALVSMPWHFADASRSETPWVPNHGVPWIRSFMKRPPHANDSEAQPVMLPGKDVKPQLVIAGNLPFIKSETMRFGRQPAPGYDRLWADRILRAEAPLKLMDGDKTLLEIKHCNVPAIAGERILYTRAYGRETGMDVYSREFRYVNGVPHSNNDWGSGHTLIPRNGFVISGWGEKCIDPIKAPAKGKKVKLCDARGNEILPPEEAWTEYPDSGQIRIQRKVRQIHLLHSSAMEGGLEAPVLAELSLHDDSGTIIDTLKVCYGTMLAAENETMLVASDDPRVWLAEADDNHTLYGYTWTLPENSEAAWMTVKLTPEGQRLGYNIHAVTSNAQ